MTPEPCDLALQHLERLKKELRNDLKATEEKLADLEAEGVVRKSRIETLASVLQTIIGDEESSQEMASSLSGSNSEISEAINKLRGILFEINKEAGTTERSDKSTNVYNILRARLISMLNALDIAAVALKKKTVLQQEEKQAALNDSVNSTHSSISRSPLGSSAIIRSQELERQRIAREIHDGPAQAVANVVLRMDILSKVSEKDPSRVSEELAKMKAIAQGALDEIRGFIFDLRPMTLQDLGLVATIKRVVTSIREMSGLNVRYVVEGNERPLGQLVSLAVFRIAQEATTNLRKYSNCETAWVHLKFLDDKVILIVEDDGAGFDLEEVAKSQKEYASFGLLGMKERADDINADLDIASSPGEGTKVVLVVPTSNNPAIGVNWEDNAK
jgi:signal transduction histidine kinase